MSSFAATRAHPRGLMLGLDVGSTTVKGVVVEPASDEVLWRDYQRHETRQAEKVLELLLNVASAFPNVPPPAWRVFATGSGSGAVAPHIGAKFVQEVNAIAHAVERRFPAVQSVVELGGQDAKIIVFRDLGDGRRSRIPSMNDKCAGGTGAVIDKINAKLRIPPEQLCQMGYHGLTPHPVAGKCGVFAETDINSLQKQGVPPAELMASLFEAIVQQNLSVLARGNTLRPTVLLLGGPNTFIRGLRECWQHNIARLWEERNIALPDPQRPAADYIIAPAEGQYFAALGAVEFGKQAVEEAADVGLYRGHEPLALHLKAGRDTARRRKGQGHCQRNSQSDDQASRQHSVRLALSRDPDELARFRADYQPQPWVAARFDPGDRIAAFIGIDGGSTSTKGVLLDTDRRVLAKAYQLSGSNPIEDTRQIVAALEQQVAGQGAALEVLGVGTTGYAKDILRDVLQADTALVETVAHTRACLHEYPGTDVIADVGGQDIKLIMLKDGRVKDFKLNTQCSAGNGYFLQSTAQDFGIPLEDYAEAAFRAEAMPEFGYGCAVFLQSDIVDFQRKGWSPEEILAGLAAVLPKNIWLYVAQIPNLARLGRKFVLQGGTQHNLAAVKAQVDFIRARFHGTGVEPEIVVHRHCGESGAIGAALEAQRLWAEHGRSTRFIGLEALARLRYSSTRGDETRCDFCENQCLRTFIDVAAASPAVERPSHGAAVGCAPDARRLIVASCEKGTVEELGEMREIKAQLDAVRSRSPNFVSLAARELFRPPRVEDVADAQPGPAWYWPGRRRQARRRELIARRKQLRIGFPRVLSMYSHAPFFLAWFAALGVPPRQLVFSAATSQDLYRRGAKRGSIDPCYPSKLAIPHVHDLLARGQRHKRLTHIFFPMLDSFPSPLAGLQASRSCPTVVATPEATHAAFVKEGDLFAAQGIVFKKTFINLDWPELAARQLYEDWRDELGLSLGESQRAVSQGLAALEQCYAGLRRRQREVLDRLEREGGIGIVLLGRPYHNDPGINHEILEELQKLGYPVFWQDALPMDEDLLERLFGAELRAGELDSPLSISDVWKNSYSENTSRKLWAAKFTARHPNLVALEFSSFKCGHDAPVYSVIEEIIERSGTPYFSFKDIDENRPAGAIKIRTETIAYFLSRYRQRLANA